MITRRDLLARFAATGAAMVPANDASSQDGPVPSLPTALRVRRLHLDPPVHGRHCLVSDSPEYPPVFIKREAVDEAFGLGTHRLLSQPDHWRMIDAGWFSGEDLYEAHEGRAFDIWCNYYEPRTEAHDLLHELFCEDHMILPGGGSIPDLGLGFGEHPHTPRIATVDLMDLAVLPRLQAAVAGRTKWIVIDPPAGA